MMSVTLFGEEHATDLSIPYWEGLHDGRLMLQHCRACDHWQHYPRYRCMTCGSVDVEWSPVSGVGRVVAATSMDRTTKPELEAMVPMPLGLIRMEEQVFVLARLLGGASAGTEVRFDGDETIAARVLTMRTL